MFFFHLALGLEGFVLIKLLNLKLKEVDGGVIVELGLSLPQRAWRVRPIGTTLQGQKKMLESRSK